MTELFNDFIKHRKEWKLKITPEMQSVIDKTEEIEKATDEILGLLDPLYPDFDANQRCADSVCNAMDLLRGEVEKRVMRHILDISDPMGHERTRK
jgi:hypothetical protein